GPSDAATIARGLLSLVQFEGPSDAATIARGLLSLVQFEGPSDAATIARGLLSLVQFEGPSDAATIARGLLSLVQFEGPSDAATIARGLLSLVQFEGPSDAATIARGLLSLVQFEGPSDAATIARGLLSLVQFEGPSDAATIARGLLSLVQFEVRGLRIVHKLGGPFHPWFYPSPGPPSHMPCTFLPASPLPQAMHPPAYQSAGSIRCDTCTTSCTRLFLVAIPLDLPSCSCVLFPLPVLPFLRSPLPQAMHPPAYHTAGSIRCGVCTTLCTHLPLKAISPTDIPAPVLFLFRFNPPQPLVKALCLHLLHLCSPPSYSLSLLSLPVHLLNPLLAWKGIHNRAFRSSPGPQHSPSPSTSPSTTEHSAARPDPNTPRPLPPLHPQQSIPQLARTPTLPVPFHLSIHNRAFRSSPGPQHSPSPSTSPSTTEHSAARPDPNTPRPLPPLHPQQSIPQLARTPTLPVPFHLSIHNRAFRSSPGPQHSPSPSTSPSTTEHSAARPDPNTPRPLPPLHPQQSIPQLARTPTLPVPFHLSIHNRAFRSSPGPQHSPSPSTSPSTTEHSAARPDPNTPRPLPPLHPQQSIPQLAWTPTLPVPFHLSIHNRAFRSSPGPQHSPSPSTSPSTTEHSAARPDPNTPRPLPPLHPQQSIPQLARTPTLPVPFHLSIHNRAFRSSPGPQHSPSPSTSPSTTEHSAARPDPNTPRPLPPLHPQQSIPQLARTPTLPVPFHLSIHNRAFRSSPGPQHSPSPSTSPSTTEHSAARPDPNTPRPLPPLHPQQSIPQLARTPTLPVPFHLSIHNRAFRSSPGPQHSPSPSTSPSTTEHSAARPDPNTPRPLPPLHPQQSIPQLARTPTLPVPFHLSIHNRAFRSSPGPQHSPSPSTSPSTTEHSAARPDPNTPLPFPPFAEAGHGGGGWVPSFLIIRQLALISTLPSPSHRLLRLGMVGVDGFLPSCAGTEELQWWLRSVPATRSERLALEQRRSSHTMESSKKENEGAEDEVMLREKENKRAQQERMLQEREEKGSPEPHATTGSSKKENEGAEDEVMLHEKENKRAQQERMLHEREEKGSPEPHATTGSSKKENEGAEDEVMLREKENKRAQQQEVIFSEREEDEGARDKVKDSKKEKKRAQQQEMLFSEREAKRRRGSKEVEGNGELGLQGGETAGCEEVQKVGSRLGFRLDFRFVNKATPCFTAISSSLLVQQILQKTPSAPSSSPKSPPLPQTPFPPPPGPPSSPQNPPPPHPLFSHLHAISATTPAFNGLLVVIGATTPAFTALFVVIITFSHRHSHHLSHPYQTPSPSFIPFLPYPLLQAIRATTPAFTALFVAIGATTPAFTALFVVIITFRTEAATTYLTLVPVVLGIVIASNSEPSFHLLGVIMCFASTAARALKSVVQGLLLTSDSEKLHSMNLLLYMSPLAVVMLLPASLFIEGNVLAVVVAKARESPWILVYLVANAAFAYFTNLTNFLVTKHTSALTLQQRSEPNTDKGCEQHKGGGYLEGPASNVVLCQSLQSS
ncbi:unnamed protein product, partial [Closterium sp. Naga37s-1]